MDTGSFKRALRRVLRQDPDVILIGEMRDEETVHTALSAAETGHLVLSTIHTVDASESVNRMIDFFPPHMHNQVRAMLAGTLKGVVSQRLVPSADGGRVAAAEIMRDDRPRPRHDHGPAADRPAGRGHRRRRLLRHADLRPGALRPRQGGPRRRRRGAAPSPPARTTSSSCSPPTASAARRWTTSPRPRSAARRSSAASFARPVRSGPHGGTTCDDRVACGAGAARDRRGGAMGADRPAPAGRHG